MAEQKAPETFEDWLSQAYQEYGSPVAPDLGEADLRQAYDAGRESLRAFAEQAVEALEMITNGHASCFACRQWHNATPLLAKAKELGIGNG